MTTLVSVRDLNIEFFDHDRPEKVVHHMNLDINPGEILGIVGESGSGKSMTALAIAGLLNRHDMKKSGSILFAGNNLLTCPRNELRSVQGNKIGIVFQEPMTSLDPVKKIGWQIEESLRIHTDMDDATRKAKALEAMKGVGLENPEEVYGEYPHELSGGMRQRAMIAAAMICGPELLIADEPTTALDVTVQAQIIELLRKINRENHTAILFISHDLSLVKQLCTRVLVMNDGRLVEEGTIESIYGNPQQEYTKELIAAIPRMDPDELRNLETSSAGDILNVKGLDVFVRESNGHRKQILSDISFAIKKGDIMGLVGESGCGKSTLAKAILGINSDISGTITHNSKYPQMIFQDPYGSLNPARKVEWILEEPLRIRSHMNALERRKTVEDMLSTVGLSLEIRDRYPNELSGGQRQRISIACALMQTPELLIADEPVSALDVTVQKQILQLLVSLKEKMGLTILFISHDLRVVYDLCDYVMIMKNGCIVEQGDTDDVYSNPRSDYTKSLLKACRDEV